MAGRYRFQGAQLGYHSAKQQTAGRLPVCATSHPRSVSVAVPRCAQLLSASEKALAQRDSALVSNPLSCDHMRTIVLIILIGLLAAGLATHLVMRHHYLAQLEMNRIALQQSANRIEELAAENARLAGVANQRKLTAHELSDLLRLRAEVGQLRRAKSQVENRSTSMPNEQSPANASQAQEKIPEQPLSRDSWSYAGYATPQDSFQTLMWAMRSGDVGYFLASLTPGAQQEAIKRLEGKSQFEIAGFLKNQIEGLNVLRLDRIKSVSDSEASFVLFSTETDDGAVQTRGEAIAVFQKIGTEWKSTGLF